MKDLKVFIADDHAILRDGLKQILQINSGFEVIGESGDGQETIKKVLEVKPDILILDISMPLVLGTEVAKRISQESPETRVIVLTKHDSIQYLDLLLKYNVKGYVLKEEAADDLVKALDEVKKGNTYLSPSISTKYIQYLKNGNAGKLNDSKTSFYQILSDREKEVLKLLTEGIKTDKIGEVLCISPKTVKVHRKNIAKKLGTSSLAELIKIGIQMGLVEFGMNPSC